VKVPAVVILEGPVGAGKTTFTKYFTALVEDEADRNSIQSPSYSLMNETEKLAHGDFYRLKDKNEITHLEIPLYLEDKNFFLVEWGMPYIKELEKEVPEEFTFYTLEINFEGLKDEISRRNFSLYYLSPE